MKRAIVPRAEMKNILNARSKKHSHSIEKEKLNSHTKMINETQIE